MFKHFYQTYVCHHLRDAFPTRVSYNRFIKVQKNILPPICAYLRQYRCGKTTGIFYIDSATIPVCHNMRMPSNKVFLGAEKQKRSSTGWFYKCKLHLVFNDSGELVNVAITPGKTDDQQPFSMMLP